MTAAAPAVWAVAPGVRAVALALVQAGALLLGATGAAAGEDVALDPAAFQHVTFTTIAATGYSADAGALKMAVQRSSSFLLRPFAQVRPVRRVTALWRHEGALQGADAARERTKAGDDGLLKIGLLLAGPAPLLPLLAPAWLRTVRGLLMRPADRMLMLVCGAASPPGSRWPSPYSASIELLALASDARQGDVWQQSRAEFPDALAVVGLWLAADGDDTGSAFTTWLRRLRLE